MNDKDIHIISLVPEVGAWKRHERNMLQDKSGMRYIKEDEVEETAKDQIDEK
jgi:hypothetical protein